MHLNLLSFFQPPAQKMMSFGSDADGHDDDEWWSKVSGELPDMKANMRDAKLMENFFIGKTPFLRYFFKGGIDLRKLK